MELPPYGQRTNSDANLKSNTRCQSRSYCRDNMQVFREKLQDVDA